MLATPLGTALGGPLTTWLGPQHTLLGSAAATLACGLIATAVLTARRRHQPVAPSRLTWAATAKAPGAPTGPPIALDKSA